MNHIKLLTLKEAAQLSKAHCILDGRATTY